MTHDDHRAKLLALYDEATAVVGAIDKMHAAATDARYQLALLLMEMEGRGRSPAAEWVRAHLAHDPGAAEAIARAYPESFFDDRPREPRALDS